MGVYPVILACALGVGLVRSRDLGATGFIERASDREVHGHQGLWGSSPHLFNHQASFTRAPSLRAMIRKPSCLISWSQSALEGGFGAFIGRQGSRVRDIGLSGPQGS